jgi:hypothetical protein
MWIIQEPKKVALWNKRHFEENNRECAACLKYSVLIICWKKYIKCNIWRVAVRPSYIQDARFLKVNKCKKSKCFPVYAIKAYRALDEDEMLSSRSGPFTPDKELWYHRYSLFWDLHRLDWWLFTNVSVKPIGPIFWGQAVAWRRAK